MNIIYNNINKGNYLLNKNNFNLKEQCLINSFMESFESNNLLPELIVKGTIYKDEPVRREEYYGIRFIGGEALEKKHSRLATS